MSPAMSMFLFLEYLRCSRRHYTSHCSYSIAICTKSLLDSASFVLDIGLALLKWVSEYAVRPYTTPDSAVLYLYYAQIA